MADKLCLFVLRFVTLFLLFWPQTSIYSLKDRKNWIQKCISTRNYSICTGSLKHLSQRICRITDLLHFADWGFMPTSVLLESFPVDQETKNYVRQVHGVVFSTVRPVPLKYKPYLVVASSDVLTEILDLKTSTTESQTFVEFVAGNDILPNSVLLSHRYGGHQFGEWAGQLGDGRAVMLGEYTNRKGERWELQLKGSGRTPYSRHGDGRAVLRSSVREFLASEAMFHLGVPTSRASGIVVSNDRVWRDQFYDGHPMQEKASVVLRLAKSWFRIGSLEILASNDEQHILKKVVDFIIEEHFPNVAKKSHKYLEFFSKVVSMTAELIAKWQSVGFAHGVCNTDNFSLLSITIDYGPFGFMDEYNPDFVPNTSDEEGRYSYKNQPNVGFFNLEKLLQALKPILEDYTAGEKILLSYVDSFNQRFLDIFRRKLGLLNDVKGDEMLVRSLLWIMSLTRADFTMSFRELSELAIHDIISDRLPKESWALRKLQSHPNWKDWLARYAERLQLNGDLDSDTKRKQRMQGELSPFLSLLRMAFGLTQAVSHLEQRSTATVKFFTQKIGDKWEENIYGYHLKWEMIQACMQAYFEVNPRYVLRNWMAQSAIHNAERNDFSEVRQLLEILKRPFTKQIVAEDLGYSSQPPSWASQLRVSCSS